MNTKDQFIRNLLEPIQLIATDEVKWYQKSWVKKHECGTAYCIAGTLASRQLAKYYTELLKDQLCRNSIALACERLTGIQVLGKNEFARIGVAYKKWYDHHHIGDKEITIQLGRYGRLWSPDNSMKVILRKMAYIISDVKGENVTPHQVIDLINEIWNSGLTYDKVIEIKSLHVDV